MTKLKDVFGQFTFKRGRDELQVFDAFKALAEKASLEAGAEVMISVKLPDYASQVFTSIPDEQNHRAMNTVTGLQRGLKAIRSYLTSLDTEDQRKILDAFGPKEGA